MSRWPLPFAGLLVLVLAGPAIATPATTAIPFPWCRPTNNLFAQRFLAQLLDLATSDDSGSTRARRALDDMPKSDSSAIWLISADSLCHRASAALDSSLYTSPHGYQLYLAHVGSRYVAFPPSDSTMEAGLWVHLDSNFAVLKGSRW